ncbi:MAG TPA: NAD(P)-dependent oxidoreductase [Pirellulales bacterium]
MHVLSKALVVGADETFAPALSSRLTATGTEVRELTTRSAGNVGTPNIARPVAGVRRQAIESWTVPALAAAAGDESWDAVFWFTNPTSEGTPEAVVETHVERLTNFIEALSARPPQRIVIVGAAEEYGAIDSHHRALETDAAHPTTTAGRAWKAAYAAALELAASRGISLVHLRAFGVYGPGAPLADLVPYILAQLDDDEQALLPSCEQVGDYTYVDDAVEACVAVATAPTIESGVYNLCSGAPLSFHAFADQIAEMLQKPGHLLRWGALPDLDAVPGWLVGDPEKLALATGWRAHTTLDSGVRRMLCAAAAWSAVA